MAIETRDQQEREGAEWAWSVEAQAAADWWGDGGEVDVLWLWWCSGMIRRDGSLGGGPVVGVGVEGRGRGRALEHSWRGQCLFYVNRG